MSTTIGLRARDASLARSSAGARPRAGHPRAVRATGPAGALLGAAIAAGAVLAAGAAPAAGAVPAADQIHWTLTGPTSVTFDWRGSGAADTLRYGKSPGGYSRSVVGTAPRPAPDSSPGPFWEARIKGLEENTLYYYRIGRQPEHTFRTPPRRGASDFWFDEQADVGCTLVWPTVGVVQGMIATDHPDLPGDDRPRFVLVPGDLSYGDQGLAVQVDQHFNDVMAWSQDAAYMPTWGNHEWATASDAKHDNLNNYEGRFDFPNSQTSPGAEEAVGNGPGEDWYWFDYGNVRFISFPEPYSGAWSDWVTRVEPIMAAAQRDTGLTFIVTFGHRPAWSSGADHQGDEGLARRMKTLSGRFSKYVLSFTAHSHHYERSDPSKTDGIMFIVGGGGGSTLGGLSAGAPAWSAYRSNHLHHVRVRVQRHRIDGYAICGPPGSGGADTCVPGSVLDTWCILSGPSGPEAARVRVDGQ